MRQPARAIVPDFQLYGEPQQTGLPDLIHIETLKDRSQHHDWEIKPHRHADLWQIMRFRTPDVGIELDGRALRTDTPAILFVPPRVIHGFRFSPQVIGTVTSIPVEVADAHGPHLGPQALLISEGRQPHDRISALLDEIEEEYRMRAPHRQRVLRALLEAITVWIARARPDAAGGRIGSGHHSQPDKRVSAFLRLVEESFTLGLNTAEYARRVGTSKSQLTRDCRSVTGRSPLRLVHERLIDEANRKLAYTPWPIAQISEALGFADLGYFSRFYRQRTGETPSQYRKRIRSRNDDA